MMVGLKQPGKVAVYKSRSWY